MPPSSAAFLFALAVDFSLPMVLFNYASLIFLLLTVAQVVILTFYHWENRIRLGTPKWYTSQSK